MSVDSIAVDKMRDILIVDKIDGDIFLEGAKVFCGCCGEPIGEMSRELKMPFGPHEFLDALKDSSVDWMIFGLRHRTCGYTMFGFKQSFGFMTLENYSKEINQSL